MVHAFQDSASTPSTWATSTPTTFTRPRRPETKASEGRRNALVSGTKSMTGTRAVGATEGIMCAYMCQNRPTNNQLEKLAEDCEELNYVGSEPIEAPDLKAAISNSMGFGGHNVVIAFTSVE